MKNQVMGLLFLSLLSSCGVNPDKSALTFSNGKNGGGINPIKVEPSKDNDPAFISLQKNLFEVSCLKCHGATQTRHSNLSSKTVVLEKFDDIIYKMTTAFDVSDKPMPPVGKGERVNPALIKELKAWKSDAQFANLQKNLFEVSCLKCHGATQTRHSNLTSKAIVIEKFDDIIYKMTNAFDEGNKPMPPVGKGTKVSPELVKELQKWKGSL